MNDFFTQPDVAAPTPTDERVNAAPVVTDPSQPPWGATDAARDGAIEINPTRRRRDSDLVLEPGADARALARLMRQDIADFVALAIKDRISYLTARLAG